MKDRRVAFLFLGETLLIPHLFPIVEALAREPGIAIDLWVATSVHEALLTGWTAPLAHPGLRIRRAPGFRRIPGDGDGRNPPLPAKLPLLARLAPHLARVPVVVCAEQTSLWIPAVLPLRTRFIDTFHGAGSMRAKGHWRRRAAWRTLVSSEQERTALIATGDAPSRIAVTGYIKAAFHQRTPAASLFPEARPVVLYTPHWQRHRSSWWAWGPEVVRRLAADPTINLIFAPHQRLSERADDVRTVAASVADLPNVHCDLDSFAMVDGSYTAAADIYLGDTSSQVVEFIARPRPCVFLNPLHVAWQDDASYAQWHAGEVVEELDRLLPAIAAAGANHRQHVAFQRDFADKALGDTGGAAPANAVRHILAALD